MTRYLLTSLFLFVSAVCFAIPAKRIKQQIILPDGTVKLAELRGDEYGHYFQADDGLVYQQQDDGSFLSTVKAEIDRKRELKIRTRNHERQTRAAKYNAQSTSQSVTMGKRRGLVILVNFSDLSFTYSRENLEDMFNKVGYSEFGMAGSVHDYFFDNSYGQFDLSFDVVGPVTASNSVRYYGRNDTSGSDSHAAELVIEAVQLADELGVDYSDYDWDGDGEVDQVYVMFAGYGEAQGGSSYTIWPHEWTLQSAMSCDDGTGAQVLDGVQVNTYACSCELSGSFGQNINPIGTACHEFAHCLGLPDMYDTHGYDNNFCMDRWDVMDYGCYDDSGRCPCGFTSYERWFCGWLTPIELSEPCNIEAMPALSDSPTAYVIYNDAYDNEYFMLENRQLKGWYKHGGGHGMLVIHVDYGSVAWAENKVNVDAFNRRMIIVPADDDLSSYSDKCFSGDPFPGSSNNHSLTNKTKPAAKFYNKTLNGSTYLKKPITDIQENQFDGTISFTFCGGVLDAIPSVPQYDSPGAPWFNLDGTRVSGGEAPSGIYINKGKKYIRL